MASGAVTYIILNVARRRRPSISNDPLSDLALPTAIDLENLATAVIFLSLGRFYAEREQVRPTPPQ